jgi:hypothetical protein
MAQWMPLCLWALHRTIKDGRLRDGFLTGGFLALQTLSSFYYGAFFAIYLLPIGAALIIGARRVRVGPVVRALAAGAGLAAVLVAPFVRPYFAARQSVGERPLAEVERYSAVPGDYLVADQWNTLFGSFSPERAARERQLFEGIVVPALALAALWPPISAARIGYAAALALAFELSLGTHGTLYPWLWEHVVLIRGLRVPARMAIVVGLSLAILVGDAVARISRAARSRLASVAVVTVIALAIAAEYHATVVLDDVWRKPPSVYDALAEQPDAVLLELPLTAPQIAQASVYMYFSTFHWHRMVDGYSGFSPRWYAEFVDRMAAFPDDRTIEDLRRRAVDYVVVHAAFYEPEDYRRLAARLAERRDVQLVTVTRSEIEEARLYRIVK